jgi:uncharacterized membrane protein
MVLAVLRQDDFLYQLVYLLHIAAIVTAFAAAIVNPRLGGLAKRSDEGTARTINRFIADGSTKVHFPALAAVGLFGILMVLLSDEVYEFSQAWISIAFVLWFAMLGLIWFVLVPAERRLGAAPSDADEKKVAMFGGIIHLLFLLMLIDMIWKPGL